MNKTDIINLLHTIEKNENIEILYACESGSRTWGFANDQSDWDIRFIYKKLDLNEYLSLTKQKEVIEYKGDDVDIVGWDIKKALMMHYKNNPNLRECLNSDIVYIDRGIADVFAGLGGFEIGVLMNHYSAIAVKHWKKYCSLDFKKEKSKKYLYVIRSIMCWQLLNRDIYPPINIHDLLNHDFINLNDDIKEPINDLISFHQDDGKITEETIFLLDNFILDSLSYMKKVKVNSFKNTDDYNKRFQELLLG